MYKKVKEGKHKEQM